MTADPVASMLVIATTNPGKFREFHDLLSDLPVHLSSLAEFSNPPVVAEDNLSYSANALYKATTIARWSGRAALADDSGLEVDVLGGDPGIRSARYAGEQLDATANIAKLLHALRHFPQDRRAARFRCVVAVATPDAAALTVEGACEGRIVDVPRGQHGFGYDPVFLYPPLGLTFAEMSAEAKHQVSHRAHACANLRRRLLDFLAEHPLVDSLP